MLEEIIEKEKELAAKKPARKPRKKKKELEGMIIMEINGEQFDILDLAKTALEVAKEKGEVENSFDIYIKPDERAVYYVVDGIGGDEAKISF